MAEKLVLAVTTPERLGALSIGRLRKRIGLCRVSTVTADGNTAAYILRNAVDAVVLDLPASCPEAQALLNTCREMNVTVYNAEAAVLYGARTPSAAALFVKRMFDVIGSVMGLLLTGLVFLVVAPQLRRKSPGPVFFAQERVGRNGRRFTLYKFRTMCVDAEAQKAALLPQNKMRGPLFKVDHDPRIIPGIGTFLRKTALDELPQMWNVLRGEMSLVGTRPPTVEEFEQYTYRHKSRLAAKPGITGVWQVSGRNKVTDFEEVVRLDNEYIVGWRFARDVKILLKTVLVVLRSQGTA